MISSRFFLFLLLLLNCILFPLTAEAKDKVNTPTKDKGQAKAILVIHGGAGVDPGMSSAAQADYEKALNEALLSGFAAWKKKASAVDVVAASVCVLEDNPLFNAGRGAVFSHDGKNELDAAIMDGRNREAGSVASVTVIKNPILAAIAVMRKSPHVMLVGSGAEKFASENQIEIVDPKFFWTQKRWDELQEKLKPATENLKSERGKSFSGGPAYLSADHRFGTVGAVALDSDGNLAAGTSTGGLTNKRWGRVGDSPIIGAGTYANNDSCAVSCTGEGEWFIRNTVAGDIAARVRYKHDSVKAAADAVIHGVLGPGKGEGGLIVIDPKGNFAMDYNSPGMFRGWIGEDGIPHSLIYAAPSDSHDR